MKIRNGFVSNSSSSSFLILGVHSIDPQFSIILKHFGLTKDSCVDTNPNGGFHVIDGQGNVFEKHGICFVTNYCVIEYIGLDLQEHIKNDVPLSQAKKILKKLFSNIGLDINTDEFELRYGEVGS